LILHAHPKGDAMKRLCALAVLGFVLSIPAAYAAKKYDDLVCRSGTVMLLSGGKEATVLSIEMKGISQETGATSQCIGVISIIGGKRKGNGYCKTMDKDGDFNLEEWTNAGKQGEGTWKFIYGTGKWKGVSGGGKYKTAKRGKPIAKGTFQSCLRVTGTYELPK
jgi:hypothetical protein